MAAIITKQFFKNEMPCRIYRAFFAVLRKGPGGGQVICAKEEKIMLTV